MIRFNHFNFNVLDLDRSLAFYKEALAHIPGGEKGATVGSYRRVFLGDDAGSFTLELTWLAGRTEPYDLGEQEFHLAFTAGDYEALREKHRAMGCICFENHDMGIYFIEDPDGYWIELVPERG